MNLYGATVMAALGTFPTGGVRGDQGPGTGPRPIPASFFGVLGEQIARQVDGLGRDDLPGEGYPGKVRSLFTARTRAEEIILRQLVPGPGTRDGSDPEDK